MAFIVCIVPAFIGKGIPHDGRVMIVDPPIFTLTVTTALPESD